MKDNNERREGQTESRVPGMGREEERQWGRKHKVMRDTEAKGETES